MSAAVAMTAMTTVLYGKLAPSRIPNAAPLFNACVMLKNPGITVTLSWIGTDARTMALVAWSTATITIGSTNSISRCGGGAAAFSFGAISSSALSIQRILTTVAQAERGRLGRDG